MSLVGSTLGSVLGDAAGAVFAAATQWVANAAVWLLGEIGHLMSATTSVDLSSSWFTQHEQVMAAVAAAVVLPMACCGVIVAVYRQDASMLVRGVLVKLPLALLFSVMSVELVRLGLVVTDKLSDTVLAAGGVDTAHVLAPLAATLAVLAVGAPQASGFLIFVGALLVVLASLTLWLELVVRSAAISVAVLFLPLSLAALVWPATAHWCRRLAETIAALVLSKLVVAAVLSLAAGAVSGGAGSIASGDFAAGISALVSGIAMLFLAVTSPFLLLRLIPAIEAGAVTHLEAARHRFQETANTARQSLMSEPDPAMTMAGNAGMLSGGLPVAGPGTAGAPVGAEPPGGGGDTGGAGVPGPADEEAAADRLATSRGEPPGSPHGKDHLERMAIDYSAVPGLEAAPPSADTEGQGDRG